MGQLSTNIDGLAVVGCAALTAVNGKEPGGELPFPGVFHCGTPTGATTGGAYFFRNEH